MRTAKHQNGFSLIELIMAMAVTLTIMTLASTLLAAAFKIEAVAASVVAQ